jgi:uncharacterized protein YukE
MSIEDTFGSVFDDEEEAAESAYEREVYSEAAEEFAVEEEGNLLYRIEAAAGSVEALVSKIPGYKGYKEKELRREADKLLRMQVARQLEDQRRQLAELQAGLVRQAQIEYVDDLERAAMKLQRLIDRIQTASYGYAGLFDAVKVKEQQLDGLYQFDRDMLGYADEIAAEVDHVGSAIEAGEGVSQAISDLADAVEQANRTFGHREEVILQESV